MFEKQHPNHFPVSHPGLDHGALCKDFPRRLASEVLDRLLPTNPLEVRVHSALPKIMLEWRDPRPGITEGTAAVQKPRESCPHTPGTVWMAGCVGDGYPEKGSK